MRPCARTAPPWHRARLREALPALAKRKRKTARVQHILPTLKCSGSKKVLRLAVPRLFHSRAAPSTNRACALLAVSCTGSALARGRLSCRSWCCASCSLPGTGAVAKVHSTFHRPPSQQLCTQGLQTHSGAQRRQQNCIHKCTEETPADTSVVTPAPRQTEEGTTERTADFKLEFGHHQSRTSSVWHGGTATIVQSPGDEVWGIVWKMNTSNLSSLDKQEGVEDGIYVPIEVDVHTQAGKVLTCRSYQMQDYVCGPPSPQYKKVICMGAKQNGLPTDYQKKLEAIETNNYVGPLPIMEKIEAAIQAEKVNFA